MYKLIICIDLLNEPDIFEEGWPQFLHHAEQMPGLVRESHSRVEKVLFGDEGFNIIHELFFATREDLQTAMVSPQGQVTGHILQRITQGQMSLLVAEHKEDDIENLYKYTIGKMDADSG